MKPVADEAGVSHEELSYIIDSTASPIATVIPFNVWPAYVGGLVVGTIPLFATIGDATSFFYKAIFFNFYGILAVVFTYTFALDLNPFVFGKMKRAIERVKKTGELDAPGVQTMSSKELEQLKVPEGYKTTNWDFSVPILTLIGIAVGGLIVNYRATGAVSVPINEAFVLCVLSAMILALIKGMKLPEVIEGFVDGVKGVSLGAIILALAVTLGTRFGVPGYGRIPGSDHQRDHPAVASSGHLHGDLYADRLLGGLILGHLRRGVPHRHAPGPRGEPGPVLHHAVFRGGPGWGGVRRSVLAHQRHHDPLQPGHGIQPHGPRDHPDAHRHHCGGDRGGALHDHRHGGLLMSGF